MALQFVYGNSGSGKSYEIYKRVIEQSIRNPKEQYLIIVPEQFTMQTQKDLVSMHPRKGIMNIDILSFDRLAYRVFEEVGKDERAILGEVGKSLVLRKLSGENQKQLKTIGGNLRKAGYINEIKSVLSEFTQYNITANELDRMVQVSEKNTSLQGKLEDIRILYHAFSEYLEEEYVTSEEVLGILSNVVKDSNLIKNSWLIFDGFTGFTPVQNQLLSSLMKLAKGITVSLTLDAKEDPFQIKGEQELFYMTKQTIYTLSTIASKVGVTIAKPMVMGEKENYRFKDQEALSFLERNLFRYQREKYKKDQEEITIHVDRNPQQESKFISREIRKLVREKGYRYKDIAVITGDMETYSYYMEKSMEEYEIPCFIDHKKTVLMNPFIEYMKAVLEVVISDFSYESVFRCLRCNLSSFTMDEIDQLENYVIAMGIKGRKKWKESWERSYKGMAKETLVEINQMHTKWMEQMEPFVAVMKKKSSTIKDITIAFYELIQSINIQGQLQEYQIQFEKEGKLAHAREYEQIYGIIIELFEKVVELLGNEKVSALEYKDILEAGFEETKVGVIPPSVDQVTVGDIERTRLRDIKILFFAGINDGNIPKSGTSGGIISQMEREFLEENKVELAPTLRQNTYNQKFYLYLNMTKPREHLYLSFSKNSSDGKSLRPSYLIHTIEKLFPKIQIQDEEFQRTMIDEVVTYESGIPYLIQGLKDYREGKDDHQWKELFSQYYKKEEYREKLFSLIDGVYLAPKEEHLSKAVAQALYGTVLENSVTRLEKYAACAFAHFLDYGLELQERQTHVFAPMDIGNVFHGVLENFSHHLERKGYTWKTLPEDIRNELVKESLEEILVKDQKNVLHSSFRNEYMIQRMERILQRTVWGLQEQVKKGDFLPKNYEVSFSMAEDLESVNIALSKDEKLKLQGRIDRLDTCEEEEKLYIKIIDYKSGNTSFDLVSLYHGLQLQLVVYMNAAIELEKREEPNKEVIPAGILYYNVKDPIVDKEEEYSGETVDESQEKVQQEILKKLKMNGLVNEEKEIIQKMDKTITKSSSVIPVSFNKDGSLSRYSSTASSNQFHQLSKFVNQKIQQLGKEILDGHIEVNPYQLGDRTGCDFCSYRSICGFDKKVPGYHYRKLKEYVPLEVWKKLESLEEDKEGE